MSFSVLYKQDVHALVLIYASWVKGLENKNVLLAVVVTAVARVVLTPAN